MGKLISVVVCTCNRAALLRVCLDSLAQQTLDSHKYEVLVVDNNSCDETLDVVSEYLKGSNCFRVVREPGQGLSHARNRGWKDAVGQFVAYIDDDAKADPDWLAQMVLFIIDNPDVEVFGGPFRAFYQQAPPAWFPPDYGSWSLGDRARKIEPGKEFINGTNMVFTRRLLESMGGFRTSLGMKGQQLSYGEETRLLLDIADRQIPIFFFPEMRVSHLVAEYKMSLEWLLLSAYASGRCSGETLNLERTLFSHLRGLFVGLAKMLTNMLALGRGPLKRRLYCALSGLCWEVGAIVEYSYSGKGCRD